MRDSNIAGSLTDEKQLNEFCMEAGARSSLYYDTHRGYGLSFNRSPTCPLFHTATGHTEL